MDYVVGCGFDSMLSYGQTDIGKTYTNAGEGHLDDIFAIKDQCDIDWSCSWHTRQSWWGQWRFVSGKLQTDRV